MRRNSSSEVLDSDNARAYWIQQSRFPVKVETFDYRKAFYSSFLEIYFRMRRNCISTSGLKSVITIVLSDIDFLNYFNFGYFTTF